MSTIKTVILPNEVNFQMLLALCILKKFGAKAFRGISSASVKSRKSGEAIYSGEFSLLKELSSDGKGMVNDAIDKCGCDDDGSLKNIIEACFNRKGGPVVAAAEHIAQASTLAKSLAWIENTLGALYDADWKPGREDIKPKISDEDALQINALRIGKVPIERTITIRTPDSSTIKMGFVITQKQVGITDGVDLQVLFNPISRYVTIMSRSSIRDVVRILRVEEIMKGRNSEAYLTNVSRIWYELASEGVSPLAQQWNYEKVGDQTHHLHIITTGATTSLSTMQIGEILTLIRFAVGDRFQSQREYYCKKFRCVSSEDFPCPWFHWMLSKCRMVRNTALKEKGTAQRENQH